MHSAAAVQIALDQLAGFLDTIERLLTESFPSAVPISAHAILMLLTRMLSLDDSARQTGRGSQGTDCMSSSSGCETSAGRKAAGPRGYLEHA